MMAYSAFNEETQQESSAMTKRKTSQLASDTLRSTIETSGLSLYRVAKNAGLSYSVVHRFMHEKRSLSMQAFDKLCASLQLELQPKKHD
jgi:hypothetical protein